MTWVLLAAFVLVCLLLIGGFLAWARRRRSREPQVAVMESRHPRNLRR